MRCGRRRSDRPSRDAIPRLEASALPDRLRELVERGGVSATVARGRPEPPQPPDGTYGPVVSPNPTTPKAFPRPQDLAGLEERTLCELGFSFRKAATIIDLAHEVVDGRIDLEGLEQLPDEEVVARLTALRGIGRWSAEYVLLRGLGRPPVFPGDDVGARNNLARCLGLETPLDYGAVRQAVSPWKPFEGMVYFHLMLSNLAISGELDA
jgi:DNA-3-methyladenine glycosylase II